MSKSIMHCQDELEDELSIENPFISTELMMKWFEDRYSTSKHLLTLYSIARGLNAKNVLEIGFGRSSFVLMRAVSETGGHLICCDKKGFGKNDGFKYLLSPTEKKVTTYLHGKSNLAWEHLAKEDRGLDFAFLDYFGDKKLKENYCQNEIAQCLTFMKTNGVIAIHDPLYTNVIKAAMIDIFDSFEYMTLPYCYGLMLIRKLGKSKYGTIEDQFLKKEDTNVG